MRRPWLGTIRAFILAAWLECRSLLGALGFFSIAGLFAVVAFVGDLLQRAVLKAGDHEMPIAHIGEDIAVALRAFAILLLVVNVVTYAGLKLIYGAAI